MKKRESQVGELNQLKLKTVVLHGDRDEELHMAQGLLLQNWFQLVELCGARLDELRMA